MHLSRPSGTEIVRGRGPKAEALGYGRISLRENVFSSKWADRKIVVALREDSAYRRRSHRAKGIPR